MRAILTGFCRIMINHTGDQNYSRYSFLAYVRKDKKVEAKRRLRLLMGDRGIVECSKMWKVSEYTIRTFLNNTNRHVSMATYLKIARAEKVSLDWLLGLERGREVRRPTHAVTDALETLKRYKPKDEVEKIQKRSYIEALRWVLKEDKKNEKIQS